MPNEIIIRMDRDEAQEAKDRLFGQHQKPAVTSLVMKISEALEAPEAPGGDTPMVEVVELIQRLKSKRNELKDRSDSQAKVIERIDSERNALRTVNLAMAGKIESLGVELENRAIRYNRLEEESEATRNSRDALRREFDRNLRELEETKEDLAKQKSANRKINQALVLYKTALARLNKGQSETQKALNHVISEKDALVSELEETKTALAEMIEKEVQRGVALVAENHARKLCKADDYECGSNVFGLTDYCQIHHRRDISADTCLFPGCFNDAIPELDMKFCSAHAMFATMTKQEMHDFSEMIDADTDCKDCVTGEYVCGAHLQAWLDARKVQGGIQARISPIPPGVPLTPKLEVKCGPHGIVGCEECASAVSIDPEIAKNLASASLSPGGMTREQIASFRVQGVCWHANPSLESVCLLPTNHDGSCGWFKAETCKADGCDRPEDDGGFCDDCNKSSRMCLKWMGEEGKVGQCGILIPKEKDWCSSHALIGPETMTDQERCSKGFQEHRADIDERFGAPRCAHPGCGNDILASQQESAPYCSRACLEPHCEHRNTRIWLGEGIYCEACGKKIELTITSSGPIELGPKDSPDQYATSEDVKKAFATKTRLDLWTIVAETAKEVMERNRPGKEPNKWESMKAEAVRGAAAERNTRLTTLRDAYSSVEGVTIEEQEPRMEVCDICGGNCGVLHACPGKKPMSPNVTIRKIEVKSDNPDRVAIRMVGAFKQAPMTKKAAAEVLAEWFDSPGWESVKQEIKERVAKFEPQPIDPVDMMRPIGSSDPLATHCKACNGYYGPLDIHLCINQKGTIFKFNPDAPQMLMPDGTAKPSKNEVERLLDEEIADLGMDGALTRGREISSEEMRRHAEPSFSFTDGIGGTGKWYDGKSVRYALDGAEVTEEEFEAAMKTRCAECFKPLGNRYTQDVPGRGDLCSKCHDPLANYTGDTNREPVHCCHCQKVLTGHDMHQFSASWYCTADYDKLQEQMGNREASPDNGAE